MTIRIDGTNTAASPGITGTDTDTGLQFGTDEVSIVTGGTDRVKINSAGSIEATSAVDVRLTLGSSGTAGTNDSVHIRGEGANLLFMNGAGGITKFEQNGTEELRIQSGGGISFNGDTAAANALDDYEEGTFTPAYSSGTSGTPSYNLQIGNYVRIGQFCYFQLAIRTTTAGNGNLLTISGLPFNSTNQPTGTLGGCTWVYANGLFSPSSGEPYWQIASNGSTMSLYDVNGNPWAGDSGGSVQNIAIWLNGFYRVS